MKAENAVKGIGRIVTMIHPGQLSCGSVLALSMTDFDHDDQQLDAWKEGFIASGGACIYDGPPKL
jgi:hypothetical protein